MHSAALRPESPAVAMVLWGPVQYTIISVDTSLSQTAKVAATGHSGVLDNRTRFGCRAPPVRNLCPLVCDSLSLPHPSMINEPLLAPWPLVAHDRRPMCLNVGEAWAPTAYGTYFRPRVASRAGGASCPLAIAKTQAARFRAETRSRVRFAWSLNMSCVRACVEHMAASEAERGRGSPGPGSR